MSIKNIYYRAYQYIFKGALLIIKMRVPDVISGEGSIEKLVNRIKSDGLTKILIVTDANIRKIGLLNNLFQILSDKKIEFAVYDDVKPNPSIQSIENAYKLYLDENCQGIIAFGGGSPMDCAKVAACRVVKPKKSVLKMRGMFKIMKKLPPFYAIPTTAGTGSETTAAAVVSNPETHEKFAIIDLNIVPHVAVLDPELTVSLPPHITSTTGMDALTHAVEAYIGLHGTKFTNENAEKATKMIFDNLEKAYSNGADLEVRNNMALAAYYAGIAFTRASVGYVHAIAHNLGGLYGVPHGLANAIVLPYVLEEYGKSAYKKLAKLAVAGDLGTSDGSDEELAQKFIQKVKDLNKNMAIPTFVKELKEADIPLLTKRALKEGNPNYPVPKILDTESMSNLIKKLLPQ
ncbi:MAG: iron-containing alcohol dehydrogenase [Promethearchaeota archaeon]